MKVKEIMTTDLVTVYEDTTLREVVGLMLEKNISGLPVIDKEGKLKGIVSESNVIRLKRKLHMPDYMQLLETMTPQELDKYLSDIIDEVGHGKETSL